MATWSIAHAALIELTGISARCRNARPLIGRDWYAITHCALKDGACAHCGHPLPGRFGAAPVALRSGFRRLRVSVLDRTTRPSRRRQRARRSSRPACSCCSASRCGSASRTTGCARILVLFLADTAAAASAGASRGEPALRVLRLLRLRCCPLPGGYLADRLLGTHRAMVIGALHHRRRPLLPGGAGATDVLPRARPGRDRHRLFQAQRLDDGRAALRARATRAATAASRSSTWGSTSARCSASSSAATSAESPRWGWH